MYLVNVENMLYKVSQSTIIKIIIYLKNVAFFLTVFDTSQQFSSRECIY